MRGIFEERERAFEAKWAHDQEIQFKILVRRNRLLALWSAAEMGLSGAEVDRYVINIVQAGLRSADKSVIFEKIRGDFRAKKINHPDATIHERMDDFFKAANDEFLVH